MSGPPPTPLHLRLKRGNPGKRPLRAEPEPTREPECPEPPPFVTGYAADEWWRVAPELWRLGLLRLTDVMPLATYCTAYRCWRMAEEALARMAEGDNHGLLIKSVSGEARKNPLTKIAADAAADMVRYAAEFGMTPVARSRIAGGWQPPDRRPSKFDGLLA